jgi:hypothetical protein
LFKQAILIARAFARDKAGSKSAASIAMIAMTTSSSISVKAVALRPDMGLRGFVTLRQIDISPPFHSLGLINSMMKGFVCFSKQNRASLLQKGTFRKTSESLPLSGRT